MADAPDAAGATEQKEKKGGGKVVTLIAVIVLMAVEGVGVYFLTKLLSPTPQSALAMGADAEADKDKPDEMPELETAEVSLGKRIVTNNQGARTVTVSIEVAATVKKKNMEPFQKLVDAMGAHINDRIIFVIRNATASEINEPGLVTIRRQIKSQLAELLKDDQIIMRIEIPEFLPSER